MEQQCYLSKSIYYGRSIRYDAPCHGAPRLRRRWRRQQQLLLESTAVAAACDAELARAELATGLGARRWPAPEWEPRLFDKLRDAMRSGKGKLFGHAIHR